MSIVFLFPGQGSQTPGMGRELYQQYPIVKQTYTEISNILNLDVASLCFNSSEKELSQSHNAQVAIATMSLAIFKLLKEKALTPNYLAGHSLGEYVALIASESISIQDGLNLIQYRGTLMQEACKEKPGAMIAVIGLNAEQIETLCSKLSKRGIIGIANYNSPIQTVVSGDCPTIENFQKEALTLGAKKVIPLKVSGAFHSPLMAMASNGLQKFIQAIKFSAPKIPIISNIYATPLMSEDEVRRELSLHMLSPVQWVNTMQYFQNNNCSQYFEIGPGKILKGLFLEFDRYSTVYSSYIPQGIKIIEGDLK